MSRATMKVAALAALVAAVAIACSSPPAEELSSNEGAVRVCTPGTVVRGIDVSKWQGRVDWARVRSSGRQFAFARVSDGTTSIDQEFERNWRGMRAAGVVRGAYQFFRPARDPVEQADLLLSRIEAAGGMEADDLPPVIDVEVRDGVSTSQIRERIGRWLDRVERALGRTPIVYTAAFMSTTVGAELSRYPLWVANFGATCPSMPQGWKRWQFWQDSDRGSVQGVAGKVDTDQFDGSLSELHAFAGLAGSAVDAGATADGGASDEPPSMASGGASSGDLDELPAANHDPDAVEDATMGSGGVVPIARASARK